MAHNRCKSIEVLTTQHDFDAAVSYYFGLALKFYWHDRLPLAGAAEATAVIFALVVYVAVDGCVGQQCHSLFWRHYPIPIEPEFSKH